MECYVKERDFSQKTVYRCELCERWFCEKHLEPRIAFIKDLRAIEKFPEIRVLYYTEIEGKEGHPDFEYSRGKFRELEIEERRRNELIKQALDKMNHYYDDVEIPEKPIDMEEARKRTVEILLKEEAEIDKQKTTYSPKNMTVTNGNKYGHRFAVPREIYSNAEYREYLNYAKTMKSVRVIVDEYYRKYGYGKREKSEEPKKKKHWWQSRASELR